jgi:hypothetical protein
MSKSVTPSVAARLIASSGSLDGLAKILQRYWCRTRPPVMRDDGSVENSHGVVHGIRWEAKRGRYRAVSE